MNPRSILLVSILALGAAAGGFALLQQEAPPTGGIVPGQPEAGARGDDPAAGVDARDRGERKDGAEQRTEGGREALTQVPGEPDPRSGDAPAKGEAEVVVRFVQRDRPMSDLEVVLRDGRGREVGRRQTGEDGRVRFLEVAPGRHRLAVDDARVPRQFSLARGVVPTTGTLDLGEVRVPVPARVHGQLLSAKGPAVGGAQVGLGSEEFSDFLGSPEAESHALSDEQGNFVVERVRPGKLFLRIDEGGHQRFERELALAEGEDLDLGKLTLALGRSLDGQIVDHEGQPIAGARVLPGTEVRRGTTTLFGYAKARAVLSAADGRFRLGGLGATTKLRVEKDGFRTVEDLEVDSEQRFVRVVLNPELGLTGRVLGIPEGKAPATRVHWAVQRDMAGSPLWSPRDPVTCAADGSFRIRDAEPGHYRLFAELEDHGFSAPKEVVLSKLAPRPVDLQLEPGGELRVRVVDGRGQALPEVQVRVELDDRPELQPGRRIRLHGEPQVQRRARSDADGRVRFTGLFQGKARLTGRHPDFILAEKECELAKGIQDTTLVLEKGGFIEGRVLDTDGRPIADAKVGFEAMDRPAAGPSWEEDLPGGGIALDPTLSAADGSYRSRALPPGRYEVWIHTDRFIEAGGARVLIGGQEERKEGRREVQVLAGQATQCDLHKEPSGTLTGTVSYRGLPVARARVFVWPADGERFNAREVRSDAEGRYRLEDLAPGTWLACAKPDQGGIPTQERPVEVTADGSEARADIELGGATVRGRLRMPASMPLPKGMEAVLAPGGAGGTDRRQRVAIMMTSNNSGDSAKSSMIMRPASDPEPVKVAADGSFRIERVPAGDWRLAIEGPGQVTYLRRPLTLEQDQDLDLGVLELEPLYPVELKVYDEDARPLALGTVAVYRKGEPGGVDERVFGGMVQDGKIRIPGLAAGDYRLRFAKVEIGRGSPAEPQEAELRVGSDGSASRSELRLEGR